MNTPMRKIEKKRPMTIILDDFDRLVRPIIGKVLILTVVTLGCTIKLGVIIRRWKRGSEFLNFNRKEYMEGYGSSD